MNQAEHVISKFATQKALADAAKVKQSTVAMWKARGVIPARRQAAVMAAAKRLNVKLTPADFFAGLPAEKGST